MIHESTECKICQDAEGEQIYFDHPICDDCIARHFPPEVTATELGNLQAVLSAMSSALTRIAEATQE
jgi:hypothetical protein